MYKTFPSDFFFGGGRLSSHFRVGGTFDWLCFSRLGGSKNYNGSVSYVRRFTKFIMAAMNNKLWRHYFFFLHITDNCAFSYILYDNWCLWFIYVNYIKMLHSIPLFASVISCLEMLHRTKHFQIYSPFYFIVIFFCLV